MSPDRRDDRVVGLLQFGPHPIIAHFAKGRMRPAVVADFVALAHCSLQDLRVFDGVLADDKKRRVDMMRSQDIEQLRCKFCTWAVVEGHRDEGPIHMNGAIADGGRAAAFATKLEPGVAPASAARESERPEPRRERAKAELAGKPMRLRQKTEFHRRKIALYLADAANRRKNGH